MYHFYFFLLTIYSLLFISFFVFLRSITVIISIKMLLIFFEAQYHSYAALLPQLVAFLGLDMIDTFAKKFNMR